MWGRIGNRGGHPAGDGDGALVTKVKSEVTGGVTEHSPKVYQGAVLPHRSPTAKGYQSRQGGRQEAAKTGLGLPRASAFTSLNQIPTISEG
nr:hypothetical protein [Marinobacter changyiensis]